MESERTKERFGLVEEREIKGRKEKIGETDRESERDERERKREKKKEKESQIYRQNVYKCVHDVSLSFTN